MSANRTNKSHDGEFETYRQIAPELFSDESLRNLIKSKNNNRDQIVAAIENIWHDTPEKQAVGSEWVTASKTAIKKPAAQLARRTESAGGRGGGRRANQPAGGRGNGENARSDKSASTASKTSTPKPSVPVPAEPNAPVHAILPVSPELAVQPLSSDSAKPAWGSGPSFAAKLKLAETEKAKAAAALVEDEKRRAAKTEEVPSTVVTTESEETVGKRSTTPKPRVRKAKAGKKADDDVGTTGAEDPIPVAQAVDRALAVMLDETLVLESAPPLTSVDDSPAGVESSTLEAAPGFLKIGKWEASASGSSEMGGSVSGGELFQFGSFGTSSSSFVPPAAQQQQTEINDNVASSWGSVAEDTVRSSAVQESSGGWAAATDGSGVPGASASGSSAMGSLFSSQQQQPKSVVEGASSTGAPRPPPGLEHNSQVGVKQNQQLRSVASGQQPQQKYNKETAQQQQLLQMQQQSMLYGQQPLQQYGQQPTQLPPGISGPAVNNRSVPPQAQPASSLPYSPYSPGFDLSQPPFMHAPYNSAPTGALSLPGSTGTAAPVSGAAAAPAATVSQSGLQTQQQQQQQQQYAPAAPFPFYGNPYYNQAYYYNQPPQVPNFYGQQGGRYQEQGPYGANPYGNPGSLYPPQQQPAGQFGESAVAYGMNQGAVGGSNQQQPQGTGKSGAKAANGAVGVSAQQSVAGLQPQDLGMGVNYGYNPYNQQQRGMDAQAWQYQQNQQAAAWAGGPIMNFGAPGGAGNGLQPNQQQQQQQGFVQQAAQQPTSHLGMNLTSSQQQQQPLQQPVNQQRGGPPAGSTPYGSASSTSSFIGGGNRNSNGVGATATGGVSQGW